MQKAAFLITRLLLPLNDLSSESIVLKNIYHYMGKNKEFHICVLSRDEMQGFSKYIYMNIENLTKKKNDKS